MFRLTDPRCVSLNQLLDERLGCSFDISTRYQLLALEWTRSEMEHFLQLAVLRNGQVDAYVDAQRRLVDHFFDEAFSILGRVNFDKVFSSPTGNREGTAKTCRSR